LKEPVFCRFSSFKYTLLPVMLFNVLDCLQGVRWTIGVSFSNALYIPSVP